MKREKLPLSSVFKGLAAGFRMKLSYGSAITVRAEPRSDKILDRFVCQMKTLHCVGKPCTLALSYETCELATHCTKTQRHKSQQPLSIDCASYGYVHETWVSCLSPYASNASKCFVTPVGLDRCRPSGRSFRQASNWNLN